MDSSVWSELQIAATNDLRAIKRAYAQRLKQVQPEEDAEGFKRLRTAYESAIFWASFAEVPEGLTTQKESTVEQPAGPAPTVPNDTPVELPSLLEPSLLERADELVQGIIDLSVKGGEDAAAESLIRLLRSEELQNIELKDLVVETFVDTLLRREVLPFVLIDRFANELGWNRINSS
jgi:hypothetical protein